MSIFSCRSPRPLTGLVAALAALAGALVLPPPAVAQSGPRASTELVTAAADAAAPIPPGPYQPTWDSLKANYTVPEWFRDAKFGIFMHWGLYSVPAHGSEWYAKHMYEDPTFTQWHTDHYGPPDKFGYKDFIPLFTAAKWDPDAWAVLFKKAGAKYIIPTAEHHDGWANWDSALTPINAMKMGPHRDLIGDLAKAVRKQGLKFGVSNHSIEHFTFINPTPGLKTDLYDPAWADFYSVADRSPAATQKFLTDWVARNDELIDKYQPDILWFDNGVNGRNFDPIKLKVAAYYYNRAVTWHKDVSISTKDDAYLAGSIEDFERQSRAPTERTDFPWEVDDPIGEKFGYVEGMALTNSDALVHELIEDVSRNGNLLLNISPRGDGTIPQEQQDILLGIGRWLDVNGDAIYGTRPWTQYGEGTIPLPKGTPLTGKDIRFTTKGNTLYAIAMAWPGTQMVVTSLATGKAPQGKIEKVELLGHKDALPFTQDADGLKVQMPADKPCDYAYALQITGLTLQ